MIERGGGARKDLRPSSRSYNTTSPNTPDKEILMAKAPKAAKADTNTETAATDGAGAAAAPKAPKAPKVEREKQNGQTKPAPGTKTGRLWQIIDDISAELKEPAPRKTVLERAEKEGFNLAMAASLYAHWRKFHGLVGKAAPGKAAATDTPPAAPADGATPPAPPAPPAEETGE